MERDFPWRVLEAPDEEVVAAPDIRIAGAPLPVTRRAVAVGVLGIAALLAAAVTAFLVLSGPHPGALVIDGATANEAGLNAATGSSAPDAALVAGPGLVVDVAGAVLRPGVYHLAAGSRVADAIAAAGGFGPRVDAAAAQALNLAAPLTDGVQVRVPSRDDPALMATSSPGSAGASASGGDGASALVNLNTATAAQLDTLPGIGPVTAAKIIASRQDHPFSTVDELQTRKLVGASTFAKLAGLVTISAR